MVTSDILLICNSKSFQQVVKPALPEIWPVLDAEKKVLCPGCHTKIPCGTAGLANWSKHHWGSKQCSDNLRVWQRIHNSDKQVGMMDMWRRKGAEKKAALVPATVSTPSLVHGNNIVHHDLVVPGEGSSDSRSDTLPACPDAARLIVLTSLQ